MRTLVIGDGGVEVSGALDVERTDLGWSLRRLPAWTRPQIPDLFMDTMAALTSGVRLRFRTDSTRIELDVDTTQITFKGRDGAAPTFDLRVDGTFGADATAPGGTRVVVGPDGPADIEFVPGSPTTLVFDGLDPRARDYEIWFPSDASVAVSELRVDDAATVETSRRDGPRWTHYGSSISHCMDVDRPRDVWPVIAATATGAELTNLGLAGQCQLDPFMGRVIGDLPADCISLKLGINLVNAASMTQRTFGPAVHGLLDTIRERQADTPILVVSPIHCPIAEQAVGPTVPTANGEYTVLELPAEVQAVGLTLSGIRATLAAIVEQRRAAGDQHLHYLDGLSLFGPADEADLYDRLHPNPAGYRRIAERFAAAAFGPGGPLASVIGST